MELRSCLLQSLDFQVVYKQRYLYPASAYAIPAVILKIPFSLFDSIIWTAMTYYVIGYSAEVER